MKNYRSTIEFIVICILFLALIIILTYPLAFKISTHIPGFFSTDEPYTFLWESWRIKYSITNAVPLKVTNLISYPFGADLYSAGLFQYLWIGIFCFFSLITTPALAYNLQLILNFLLTGVFTYLLVFRLTGNKLSAILSGIIFAFCPYQFVRAWQHFSLTYNQWIPLCLLAAIMLKENQSRRNAVLFSAAMILLFSFDYTIMYMGTITIAVFLLYILFYNWKIKIFQQRSILIGDLNYIKKLFFIGIAVFIILLPQFFNYIKNRFVFYSVLQVSAHNPYHRAFEDLFVQSAKPLSYLLPAVVHPIFGKFTEQFVGSQFYGVSFTEHTLYLGWTPLILAFIAFRRWKKRRDDFYIGFFVLLAIAAWLFSQPPWWNIFGFKVYMPSFFMYKILPMFRAYCRFGIVLMLAVAVLAGFGLKFILLKLKAENLKLFVTILFCALVLFEFWNWPPYKVIDVSGVPAVYYWLREQPGDFAVAEYPLDADSPNEMYKFYQTRHEKKIINATTPGTYANQVAQEIKKLSEPKTAGILKWMGVRYVLVHRDGYIETELIEEKEELDRIPQNPKLKLVKSFPIQDCPQKDIMCVQKTGPIDVYEVIAPPIAP